MVRNVHDLNNVIESVHSTMLECKQTLRNSALLGNLVNLKPIIHNSTRWSGKLYMLEQFLQIYDELLKVCEDERSTLSLNGNPQFKGKVQRYAKQLRGIDEATKYLQASRLSLFDCQDSLDMLVEDGENGLHNQGSEFYRCFLKAEYHTPGADILPDPFFESRVCKLQSNRAHAMTDLEKKACHRLLLDVEESQTEANATEGTALSYRERKERQKRRKICSVRYKDCGFILGSVAEVERLWSIATYILRDERKKLDPVVFEALIFLRVNRRFWDVYTVRQALQEIRLAA